MLVNALYKRLLYALFILFFFCKAPGFLFDFLLLFCIDLQIKQKKEKTEILNN